MENREEEDWVSNPSLTLPARFSSSLLRGPREGFFPGWEEVLLSLWLAGTLACWSIAALRLGRLRRLLRTVPPAIGEIAERINHLAKQLGLGRSPRAYLVPGVMPPMLLVLGRCSWLLLPAPLWERLDPRQRDTLLLHELAHLRRSDHRVRWLELVVLGLYWWHPVAWWACRALRDAEEECCDAWVVWAAPESGPAYAATLVETVAYLSGAPAALPAGASGAGPVRLIKRRLTMILRGTTPRCLSRPALLAMLLLGLGLLPLVPTLAQSGPSKLPPDLNVPADNPDIVIGKSASLGQDPHQPTFLRHARLDMRGCEACHQTHSGLKKAEPGKLHDEIVRLMDEVARQRQQLTQSEAKLKDALKRFQAQQERKVPALPQQPQPWGKQPGDRRLDDVEKKLEQLLKEIEMLRKDLRPRKSSSSSSGSSDVHYTNKRQFTIPVSWHPATPEGSRKARLYVTTTGGKSYGMVGDECLRREPGRISSFSYHAASDGEYGFLLVLPDKEGNIPYKMVEGREPMLRVIVDTVRPKVVMHSEPEQATGAVRLSWDVTDNNLDVNTLRLAYRVGDDKEWQQLDLPLTAKGTCMLRPPVASCELRMSAADKAGNVGEAKLRHPSRP
jgi:beta-lactamase regulating signal transducer with metallopeptidase domain